MQMLHSFYDFIKVFIVNISGYPEKILIMAGADKLIEFLEEENEAL